MYGLRIRYIDVETAQTIYFDTKVERKKFFLDLRTYALSGATYSDTDRCILVNTKLLRSLEPVDPQS